MIFQMFQFYGYGRFGPFSQALVYLEQFGLLDTIIPFALIFAVLYSAIKKSEIFEDRITLVVTLSITLVTVIPHVLGLYPSPYADPIHIINQSLPQIALLLVIIVLVLILAGAITGGAGAMPAWIKQHGGWVALVIMGLVFYGALTPPGYLPGFLKFLADPVFYTLAIVLLVFGGIIWLVTKSGGNNPPAAPAARQGP